MIQINELRVGNHFKWSDLASMGKDYGVTTLNNIKYHKFFEPIPLTKEILLKCGFEWLEDTLCFADRLHIIEPSENGYMFIPFCTNDKDSYIKIIHLHQLQNLYFTLTGEELEINL